MILDAAAWEFGKGTWIPIGKSILIPGYARTFLSLRSVPGGHHTAGSLHECACLLFPLSLPLLLPNSFPSLAN